MTKPFYTRHKGPYSFSLSRRFPHLSSEAIEGTYEGEQVEAAALSLLDTNLNITSVHVWSESEQQYVMTYPTSSNTVP